MFCIKYSWISTQKYIIICSKIAAIGQIRGQTLKFSVSTNSWYSVFKGYTGSNPRNAHLKKFQHYLSISLQLQLSILLTVVDDKMQWCSPEIFPVHLFYILRTNIAFSFHLKRSVTLKKCGNGDCGLVGWEGDTPSPIPSTRRWSGASFQWTPSEFFSVYDRFLLSLIINTIV